jgi:hypothetical protein
MQPVLAFARDALRRHLRDEETEAFLEELQRVADEVDNDETVANTFIESDVEARPSPVPPATLKDIETALTWLEKSSGSIKAEPVEMSFCWRLTGLGNQPLEVTTARELLERDSHLVPLTVGTEIMPRLAENLPLPSPAPLVLVEHTSGAYRGFEARWVHPDGVAVVASAKQLIDLITSWDGKLPPPALLVKARNEAVDTARRRVVERLTAAGLKEAANLRRQAEAARLRLMRELGRTLRCIGTGDLNTLFRQQVQRESRPDGRYHRALKQLGGYPVWIDTEIEAINVFVESLNSSQRQARLLGSEVDAALDDPRWKAKFP